MSPRQKASGRGVVVDSAMRWFAALMLLAVSFAVVLLASRLPLLGGSRLPALR